MGNDQLKSPAANSMGTEKLQLWIHGIKEKGNDRLCIQDM